MTTERCWPPAYGANAGTIRVFIWSYHEWDGRRPEAQPAGGFPAQEDNDSSVEIPIELYNRFVAWEREHEALQAELAHIRIDF